MSSSSSLRKSSMSFDNTESEPTVNVDPSIPTTKADVPALLSSTVEEDQVSMAEIHSSALSINEFLGTFANNALWQEGVLQVAARSLHQKLSLQKWVST
jgi:hypothetical protein